LNVAFERGLSRYVARPLGLDVDQEHTKRACNERGWSIPPASLCKVSVFDQTPAPSMVQWGRSLTMPPVRNRAEAASDIADRCPG
jgi:hypothetical protein